MEQHKLNLSTEQQKKFSRCFPRLLHFALSEVEKMGLSHILSWEPSGTQFKIRNQDLFIAEVASRFFVKQSKIRSFYRQLNLWGFKRVGKSMDNVWRREYFSREDPEGIQLINRCDQEPSNKKKPTAKKQTKQIKQTAKQQQQKKASPSSKAKSKAVAATEIVAVTPIRTDPNTVTDNKAERNQKTATRYVKKIIRDNDNATSPTPIVLNSSFSALLNEINADADEDIVTSPLRQDKNSVVSDYDEKDSFMIPSISSNASIASCTLVNNISDEEQEEQQSIQQDHEDEHVPPPPLLQSTVSTTLPDFDAYMSFLEEEDDNNYFEMGPMV